MAVQQDILTDQHVRGGPALVVEILSPGTRQRDESLKRRLYERVGVREYWLVDPDREIVTVCRRTIGGALATVAELAAARGDVLMTPLLEVGLKPATSSGAAAAPLSIPLATLFG